MLHICCFASVFLLVGGVFSGLLPTCGIAGSTDCYLSDFIISPATDENPASPQPCQQNVSPALEFWVWWVWKWHLRVVGICMSLSRSETEYIFTCWRAGFIFLFFWIVFCLFSSLNPGLFLPWFKEFLCTSPLY